MIRSVSCSSELQNEHTIPGKGKNSEQQESIPVGCVPPAFDRGWCCPGGSVMMSLPVVDNIPLHSTTPLVDKQNITLSQTSFAGSNNFVSL